MITLAKRLKCRCDLKIAVISNEGRELNAHRIAAFGLNQFVDFFVSSCFVGLCKPDVGIFRLAVDAAQAAPQEIIYIENTPMFISIGQTLGLETILHTAYDSTLTALGEYGLLSNGKEVPNAT